MGRLDRRPLRRSHSRRRTAGQAAASSAGASWSRWKGSGKCPGALIVADFECSLAAAV